MKRSLLFWYVFHFVKLKKKEVKDWLKNFHHFTNGKYLFSRKWITKRAKVYSRDKKAFILYPACNTYHRLCCIVGVYTLVMKIKWKSSFGFRWRLRLALGKSQMEGWLPAGSLTAKPMKIIYKIWRLI